jgi:DNA-binding transcriptional LysR family regulator
MATSEWLRTFIAIYRSGSVSGGAERRGLSQPAASQQLASLERQVGLPLFTRTPRGVEPTRRGRELHAQVADSLDQLEPVLVGLDGGPVAPPDPVLRLGSSAEFFSAVVVPRLTPDGPALVARFGTDHENLALLEHGELDLAVTSISPGRRSLSAVPIGMKRFVLVGEPGSAPAAPLDSLEALGAWLAGRPWVAYSAELPMTRRFWLSALGRPFAGDLRLVAPDLRAVAAAVERGLGCSLLPDFSCAEGLERGTMVELHPVAPTTSSEPWFACTRTADLDRNPLHRFVTHLSASALRG